MILEMGRPELAPNERRSALIQLRCKAEQKERFRKAATRAGLSLSDWLVQLGENAAPPQKKSRR